jgi:2-dehydro-3-deoxygluconokinase
MMEKGKTGIPGPGRELDIVSLGECLVEFNRGEGGEFHPGFAGDAFNALFYAARLGARTGFISSVGDDLFTPMIVEGIEREGIDTSRLLRIEGRRNGLYFIELDERGEYTFHFWRERSAATLTLLRQGVPELASYISTARVLLITGVTLAVMEGEGGMKELLEMVKGETAIAFDTNYRARLWSSPAAYRERFEPLLPLIDILLPTRSDLEAIYPGEPVGAVIERCAVAGPATIAMKCGADGCALWDGSALRIEPPPEPIEPIDTTGAGDAFNAGFLAMLLRDEPLGSCCTTGQRVAARALRVRGAIDRRFSGSAVGL